MVKTKQNKNMVACLKKMRIYQITESMDILLPHPDPLSTLLCAWKAALNGPHQFSPLLSGLGLWGIPSGGWKMGAQWDQSIYSPNPLPAAALEAGGTADPFLSSGPCQILPPLAPFDLLLLFSSSPVPNSLKPHGLQHACPCSMQASLSFTIPQSLLKLMSTESMIPPKHLTLCCSVVPFSSCLQSFPASVSFQMSQFFAVGGQSTGASASASVRPMNIQHLFPLGLTGLISLQSKGLLEKTLESSLDSKEIKPVNPKGNQL